MQDSQAGEVTRLLKAWHGGDEEADRQLSAILYDELKRQAALCMRGERTGITLQATALVHEAFVRLAGAGEVDWQDRKHFLAVAARTMRRVLVDLVRAKATHKRGAGGERAALDSGIVAQGASVLDLIAVDEALEKLSTFDPRKVRVIELRFFAGLTVEETAEVLDVAPTPSPAIGVSHGVGCYRSSTLNRTLDLRDLEKGRRSACCTPPWLAF